MKIIDWRKKGNVVRFYLGDNDEYWGDDWDDKPYEHNAGRAYDKYIKDYRDVAFPFEWMVVEPADDWTYQGNSPYCKEDFKKRLAPCVIAVPPELQGWSDDDYHSFAGADMKCVWKFYFGDDESVLDGRGREWITL